MPIRKLRRSPSKKGPSPVTSNPLSFDDDETRIYIGIDPSLADTGLTIMDQRDNILFTKSIKTKPGSHDVRRCIDIVDTIIGIVEPYIHDHKVRIAIEPIPFARRPTGKTFTRHELVGMLKRELLKRGVEVYMIGATTIKNKFAGKGSADKTHMQAAVYNRFKRLVKNDNIADSIAIAALLSDYIERKLKLSIERLPQIV